MALHSNGESINKNLIGKKRVPQLSVSDLEKRVSNLDNEVKEVIERIIQKLESNAVSSQSNLDPVSQGKSIASISLVSATQATT